MSTDAVGRITGPTAMPGTTGVPSRTLVAESAGADVLGAMKVYLVREPGAGSVTVVRLRKIMWFCLVILCSLSDSWPKPLTCQELTR